MNTTLLIGIACATGILGDTLLQLGSANGLGGPTGWGLKTILPNMVEQSLFLLPGA